MSKFRYDSVLVCSESASGSISPNIWGEIFYSMLNEKYVFPYVLFLIQALNTFVWKPRTPVLATIFFNAGILRSEVN